MKPFAPMQDSYCVALVQQIIPALHRDLVLSIGVERRRDDAFCVASRGSRIVAIEAIWNHQHVGYIRPIHELGHSDAHPRYEICCGDAEPRLLPSARNLHLVCSIFVHVAAYRCVAFHASRPDRGTLQYDSHRSSHDEMGSAVVH
eukprot:scaffold150_cov204-Pinguiococcus_pyrenoidosus.AAC.5